MSRGAPAGPKRTRSQIFHALDPLRDLRNRVSHHEAVWDRKLNRSHREILETIAWINRDLAALISLRHSFSGRLSILRSPSHAIPVHRTK